MKSLYTTVFCRVLKIFIMIIHNLKKKLFEFPNYSLQNFQMKNLLENQLCDGIIVYTNII